MDTTEQRIPRPIDSNTRKMFIQIRKKHMVKIQFIVNNHHGFIIHKPAYKKGRSEDYNVYKETYPVTHQVVI